MKNKKINIFFRLITLIFIFVSITFFFSCSKDQSEWSVYSIEILFNDENIKEFTAHVGEEFVISITVNNYQENYKFSKFYAWIEYNNQKIVLDYGDNVISFDQEGRYQVKVMIIDLIGRLMTKRMPFIITKVIDKEPPKITGDILNTKQLNAYRNIGVILPDFEIIDNIDGKIEPSFLCKYGKVEYYDKYNTWYYINETNNDDILTISGKDSSDNEIQFDIIITMRSINESVGNWLLQSEIDKNIIFLNEKSIYFEGESSFSIIYDTLNYDTLNPIINDKSIYLTLNFLEYDKPNSCLELKFFYDLHSYYILKFEFKDNSLFINNSAITFPESLKYLNIVINKTSIKLSNDIYGDIYLLSIDNQYISCISFEMSD
ncbi:MAG TPA: hypothetical protein VIL23_01325, partial [Clostridia bacterium]